MQAAYSAIDFDYLEYAKLRWDEYRKQKAVRLQAVARWLASGSRQ